MYTMKQTCLEVNMPYETLKFYCNEGLVPNVKRDKNNRRIFDDHDVAWIKSLVCLKNCNMSIAEMHTYLDMCLGGKDTIPERKVMLAGKRQELEEKIRILQEAVAYIDWKQNFYNDILSGKTEYFSNLTPPPDSANEPKKTIA